MKKVLCSILGLAALSGCAYDYYKGGVKYVQDGADCIYYAGERGQKFSNDVYSMGKDQKVVYRNTLCASLLDKDSAGQAYVQDRQVLASAAKEASCNSCACKSGCSRATPVMKRRYVIVSAM
ncbi:MAG: hypothetical protein LBF37_03985 [Rickettsiales bacterium]|jgi:hypothetical protein|nr:hypothetical protein [Rickettsiales bacterium]